jgi:hypothetical protein
LASVLVALRDSPDAPENIEGSSLAVAFRVRLADLHTVNPTNIYLVNCLLSGLSFKHDLAWSPGQYLEIRDGLIVDGNSWMCELFVIGACIQLLTVGSKLVLDRNFTQQMKLQLNLDFNNLRA